MACFDVPNSDIWIWISIRKIILSASDLEWWSFCYASFIKCASYDCITHHTGKCLIQVGNEVIKWSVVPSFKVNLSKWDSGKNQLYGLIYNINFKSFSKGQITECSSPPLHKAWISTANSHCSPMASLKSNNTFYEK